MIRRVVLALAFLVAAFCFGAAALGAQRPDCALARPAFDNYIGDGTVGGFAAPRYVHHAVHLGLSVSVAELAHWRFHLSAIPATAIGAAVLTIPHARDLVEHRPVGGRDALADVTIASLPVAAALGWSGHSWQSAVLATTTIFAAYLAAACWASP